MRVSYREGLRRKEQHYERHYLPAGDTMKTGVPTVSWDDHGPVMEVGPYSIRPFGSWFIIVSSSSNVVSMTHCLKEAVKLAKEASRRR